jgi:uncharacterized protein YbaR (Trm112 family)
LLPATDFLIRAWLDPRPRSLDKGTAEPITKWKSRTMNSTPSDRPASAVDPKLLEILVCPKTRGPLEYDAAKQELISRSGKLAYPIRDGIPILLPSN